MKAEILNSSIMQDLFMEILHIYFLEIPSARAFLGESPRGCAAAQKKHKRLMDFFAKYKVLHVFQVVFCQKYNTNIGIAYLIHKNVSVNKNNNFVLSLY